MTPASVVTAKLIHLLRVFAMRGHLQAVLHLAVRDRAYTETSMACLPVYTGLDDPGEAFDAELVGLRGWRLEGGRLTENQRTRLARAYREAHPFLTVPRRARFAELLRAL